MFLRVFVFTLLLSGFCTRAIAASLEDLTVKFEALAQENAVLRKRVAALERPRRLQKPRLIAVNTPDKVAYLPTSNATAFTAEKGSWRNRRDGFYAGISGSYGSTAKNPSLSCDNVFPFGPCIPTSSLGGLNFSSLRGTEAGFTLGFNAFANSLFIGIEANVHFDRAKLTGVSSTVYSTSLPVLLQSISVAPVDYNPPITELASYTLRSSSVFTRTISKKYGGDLNMRAGVTFSDWLLYMKTGIGIQRFSSKETSDPSGSVICVKPVIVRVRTSPTQFYDQITGCGSIVGGPAPTVSKVNDYLPYLALGLGVERDFGPYFARIDATARSYQLRPNKLNIKDMFISTALTASVGLRF